MLIDSVMEMASISVISKDGQETNHSQCPGDGRAAKPVPGGTAMPGARTPLPNWTRKGCRAPFQQLCPPERGNGAGERGLLSSGCSLEGMGKDPQCLAFPEGNRSPRVPAAPEEATAGSRSLCASRRRGCSAFEGLYLITLLHNNITCVFPLLIHLCLP